MRKEIDIYEKKFLKIIGIITGVYLIADILCLAFMGYCELLSHLRDAKYDVLETIYRTWNDAIEKFKIYFGK